MSTKPRIRNTLLGIVAALALSACQGLVDGARERFSQDNVCPADRVEVHARPDLHPSSFGTNSPPSPDIAGDPERLKMWQDQRAEARAWLDDHVDIAETIGCGKRAFYACERSTRHLQRMTCNVETEVPGGM